VTSGCSNGDNGSIQSRVGYLSDSQASALHAIADDLAEENGWTPAVPLYLPDGVIPVPYHSGANGSDATLLFNSIDPGGEVNHIEILQSMESPADLGQSYDLELSDGTMAWSDTGFMDETHNFYTIDFVAGDRYFHLFINWQTEGGSVTSGQIEETRRVAQSLIDDLRSHATDS